MRKRHDASVYFCSTIVAATNKLAATFFFFAYYYLIMFTFGGFILGLLIMTISFFLVRFGNQIEIRVGNIANLLGFYGSNYDWLNWKTIGVVGIIIGFLVAFGFLQEFFALTLGQFIVGFGPG